jgi:phenylalanine-4-hydroxylase
MESNEILDKLPKHLLNFVIEQPYNAYTAEDHAIWRYVMKQNVKFLGKVAHHSYLDGLKRTGISLDRIPHMYGMNRIMKEIGWAAVAVDGFIPPAAFMEFQAHNVLVIAADIRPIDQVEYTPAPDIIHEAAGHAPIIADVEYAAYLVRFGELGCKAFSSKEDYRLYEAIRHLSIVKADPYSSVDDIRNAEEELSYFEKHMGAPSEMAMIRNLHWWTVEYGLVGDLKGPKIYGAGLLSSIGESYSALNNGVKHLPYTLDAILVGFDITTKQPQLFVTPDFAHLSKVLEEFADTMALRKGGMDGISKAIDSGNTATVVLSSGIQISGTFTSVKTHGSMPAYIGTTGPTTLNFSNKQIPGQGKDYHSHGFSSPVGKLKNTELPLEAMSDGDLSHFGIKKGNNVRLEFESGVVVTGILENTLRLEGKNVLFSFSDCTVTRGDEILFQPEWGIYDMAVGNEIISAYSGPADPEAFGLEYPAPAEKTHKISHSAEALNLHKLYEAVGKIRENELSSDEIPEIWKQLKNQHPNAWLLLLELMEVTSTSPAFAALEEEIRNHLLNLKAGHPEFAKLITDGLAALGA